jgi:hypothetical protein
MVVGPDRSPAAASFILSLRFGYPDPREARKVNFLDPSRRLLAAFPRRRGFHVGVPPSMPMRTVENAFQPFATLSRTRRQIEAAMMLNLLI